MFCIKAFSGYHAYVRTQTDSKGSFLKDITFKTVSRVSVLDVVRLLEAIQVPLDRVLIAKERSDYLLLPKENVPVSLSVLECVSKSA